VLCSTVQQQEASEARKSLKLSQKEIISTNEKKHKVKLGISALKNKMLKVGVFGGRNDAFLYCIT
jgi:hypothetical protein